MQATARLLGQTVGAALVALMFGLFHEGGTRESLIVAACVAVGGDGGQFLAAGRAATMISLCHAGPPCA